MDFDKWFDSYSKRPKEYWSLRDAWNAALEQLERAQPATPSEESDYDEYLRGEGLQGSPLREPQPSVAAQETDGLLIRCHGCNGTVIFKKTQEGFLFFHSCSTHSAALKASVREEALKLREALQAVMKHVYCENDYTARQYEDYYAALELAKAALAHTEKASQPQTDTRIPRTVVKTYKDGSEIWSVTEPDGEQQEWRCYESRPGQWICDLISSSSDVVTAPEEGETAMSHTRIKQLAKELSDFWDNHCECPSKDFNREGCIEQIIKNFLERKP